MRSRWVDPHCPDCLYLMIVFQRLVACDRHAQRGDEPPPTDLPRAEELPLFSGEVYQRLRALRARIRAQALGGSGSGLLPPGERDEKSETDSSGWSA